ncbi:MULTISPECIES: hypothetical protein [unclassified Paraburkholderia]|uniref:hypothetical protein n=1 Tax=unclassified Paraburkholderia TaxID=2615204 RepID=UPI002AB21970|nr:MULTISPECIES: hypothetical protein [unclassified Paraburkholderia]
MSDAIDTAIDIREIARRNTGALRKQIRLDAGGDYRIQYIGGKAIRYGTGAQCGARQRLHRHRSHRSQ